MKYWVEVASGDFSIEPKLNGEKGLHAPNTSRHRNMMKNILPRDKILHYLTSSLTSKKWRSSFVATSSATSRMEDSGPRLVVKLENIRLLTNPVRFRDFKIREGLSEKMRYAINMSMQAYLFEIEKEDFDLIIRLSE